MIYQGEVSWSVPEHNIVIYRYYTFDKFIRLLDDNAVYFRELALFRETDPMEGRLPEHNKTNVGNEYLILQMGDEIVNVGKDELKKKNVVDFFAKTMAINCWTMNGDETEKMWNGYAKDRKGVIVKSSRDRLYEAFAKNKEVIYIGMVSYIDYSIYETDGPNPISYCYLKAKDKFEWENELRLAYWDVNCESETMQSVSKVQSLDDVLRIDLNKMNGIKWKNITCDLDVLIEEIIVSPWASSEFVQEVEDLIRNKNINAKIRSSKFIGNIRNGALIDL